MKYLTEFRNGEIAQRMAREIAQVATRPWKIMEVCGGQTHSIIRNGIDQMLPPGIEMIHGPGCPVCVTPLELIDKALAIAAQPGVIFCSFGDMLRVPGTEGDLFQVKGRGGDVRMVYSPLDAVELAVKNPDKQVVFFGVGFETTAPANAMSVHLAKRRGLKNFSVLVSHVLVPPAIEAIMSVARQPGAGVSGRGPCVQRDGLLGVSAARREDLACRLWSRALSRSICWMAFAARWCNWRPDGTRWRMRIAAW